MNKIIKVCIAVSCFCLSNLPAYAALIPVDVTINGSVELDLDPATGSNANFATQTATLDQRLSAVDAATNITGLSPDADNPRTGQLTEMGDGFGASFNVADTLVDNRGDIFFDFSFNLSNGSATDDFVVSFLVDFSHLVNADGIDSFISSELTMDNASDTEFFFSDLTSDTFTGAGGTGDEQNGAPSGTFGDVISNSGMFSFDITLLAGASDSFTGLWSIDGGNFVTGDSINGNGSAFISVANVRNITQPPTPNPIPEPSSLLLYLLAVFGLLSQSKKRLF